MWWCCTTRQGAKMIFNFENGTCVLAYNLDDAVRKLKNARAITHSNQQIYEFGPDVYINAVNCNDAQWHLYLDKKDPTLRRR